MFDGEISQKWCFQEKSNPCSQQGGERRRADVQSQQQAQDTYLAVLLKPNVEQTGYAAEVFFGYPRVIRIPGSLCLHYI